MAQARLNMGANGQGDGIARIGNITGGDMSFVKGNNIIITGNNVFDSVGRFDVTALENANVQVNGPLDFLMADWIDASQVQADSANKNWRIRQNVADSNLQSGNGGVNFFAGGNVINSMLQFDYLKNFQVNGDVTADPGQQSMLKAMNVDRLNLRGMLRRSILAIAVNPVDGIYFNGNDAGLGGTMKWMKIGGYDPNNAGVAMGIAADNCDDNLRIGNAKVTMNDLPIVDGDFNFCMV
jgi:hypothetical protein